MNTIKNTLLAGLMLASALVYADCPDGGRTTTAAEREDYVATSTAIKAALPPAPAGWRILDRNVGTFVAPDSTCKGSVLVPGYYLTYIWTDQEKRAAESQRQTDDRIRTLALLTPEEQKQVDDLTRQGRVFERQAVAVIRTNPEEAARLRAQAKPFSDQVKAIRKAHLERVLPQMDAIRNENVPGITGVGTEVGVSIGVRGQAYVPSAKAERVQIAGVSGGWYNGKDLVMSLGRDRAGRTLEVTLTGTCREAETIAGLIASSSLRTVVAKKR